ncbi:hypothetical protein D9M69_718180 [compost metagenome]
MRAAAFSSTAPGFGVPARKPAFSASNSASFAAFIIGRMRSHAAESEANLCLAASEAAAIASPRPGWAFSTSPRTT